jgi:uncharacterized protein (TIGR03067 family)
MRLHLSARPVACSLALGAALLCAALTSPARGADDKAIARELKKLQGTWVVVEAERDGAALDRIKGNKLIVKDHQFTVVTKTAELKGDLTLSPGKTPKAIDFQHQEGALRDKKWEGIYKLDGDKLTLCYAEADSGKDRPDKFETYDGSNRLLIVVERKKK